MHSSRAAQLEECGVPVVCVADNPRRTQTFHQYLNSCVLQHMDGILITGNKEGLFYALFVVCLSVLAG